MAKKVVQKASEIPEEFLKMRGKYLDSKGTFDVIVSDGMLQRGYTKPFGNRLFTPTSVSEIIEGLKTGEIKVTA